MSDTLALTPTPATELRALVTSYNLSARPGRRVHTAHLRAVYARGFATAPDAKFAHIYGMSRVHSFLGLLTSCSTPVNPLTPDRDLLPPHHPLSLRAPEAVNPPAARSLTAAIIIDSLGRPWKSFLHPRDRYGRFIPTLGNLRLFSRGSSGVSDKHYATGRYVGANPDGSIQVRLNAVDDPNQQDQIGETVTIPADQVATIAANGREQKADISGRPTDADEDSVEYRNAVTEDAFAEGVDRLGDTDTPAVNVDGTPYAEGDRITTQVHSEDGGQDEIASRNGTIRKIATTKNGTPNALIEFDGEPDEENPDGKPEFAILDLNSPDISKGGDIKATLPGPQTEESRATPTNPDIADINRRSSRVGVDRPAAARLAGFEQTGTRMTTPNVRGESFGVGHVVKIIPAKSGRKSRLIGVLGVVGNVNPSDGGARIYYRDPDSGKWKQTKTHFAVDSVTGVLPGDPDVISFMADTEGSIKRGILPNFKRHGVSDGAIDERVATGYDGIEFRRADHVAGRRGSDNRVVQGVVQNIIEKDGTVYVQPYGGGEAIAVSAKYIRYVRNASSKFNGGNRDDVHVGPQQDSGRASPDRESLKDILYAAGFSDDTISGIDTADTTEFGDIIRADPANDELERRQAAVAVLDEADPARHSSQARADRMYGEVVRAGIAGEISGETVARKPPEGQVGRESIRDEFEGIFDENYFGPSTPPAPDAGPVPDEEIPDLPEPGAPTPEPEAEPESEAEPEIEPITDYEFRTHVYPNALENWTTDKGRYPESDADYAEVDQWAETLRQSYNDGSDQAGWRDDPNVSEETANARFREEQAKRAPTPAPEPTPESPPPPAPAETPVARAIRQYTNVAQKLGNHPDPEVKQVAKDINGLAQALQGVQDASDRGVDAKDVGTLLAAVADRARGIQQDNRPLIRRFTGPGSTPQQKNVAINGIMKLLQDAQNIGKGGQRSLTPDTNPLMFDPKAKTVAPDEIATPTPEVPDVPTPEATTPAAPEAPAASRSLPEQALAFPDAAESTPEEMDQAFADMIAAVNDSTGISPIVKERARGALTRARRAVEKSFDEDRTDDERENLLHAAADRLDQVGSAVGGDLGDALGVIGGKLETLGGDLPTPGLPRPPAPRGPTPGSPIPRGGGPRPTPREPEPGAPVRRQPEIPGETAPAPTPTPTPARPTPTPATPAEPETPTASTPGEKDWDFTVDKVPTGTPETPLPIPEPEPEPEPEVDFEPPTVAVPNPLPEPPDWDLSPEPEPEPFPEPPPPNDKISTSALDPFDSGETLPKESGTFADTPLELMDDLHRTYLARRNGLLDQGADVSEHVPFDLIASAARSMRNSGRLSGSFNEWLRGRGPEGDPGTGADGRELLGRLIDAYKGGANTQGALGQVIKGFEREWMEKHDYFRTPPPAPDVNTPEGRAKATVETIMNGIDSDTFHNDDDAQNAALAKSIAHMETLFRLSKFDTGAMRSSLATQFEAAGVDQPKSAASLAIRYWAGQRGIVQMKQDKVPLHRDESLRQAVGRIYSGLTDPAGDVSLINMSFQLFSGDTEEDRQVRADSATAMAELLGKKLFKPVDDRHAMVQYYETYAEMTRKGRDTSTLEPPQIHVTDDPNFRRKNLGGDLGNGYVSSDGKSVMVKNGSGYQLSIQATQQEMLSNRSRNGSSLLYYNGSAYAPIGTYRGPATATIGYKNYLANDPTLTSADKSRGKQAFKDSKLRDPHSFVAGAANWSEPDVAEYNDAKRQAGFDSLRESLGMQFGQAGNLPESLLEDFLPITGRDRFMLPSARVFRNGNVNIEIGEDTVQLWGDDFDSYIGQVQDQIAKLMGIKGVHDRPVAIRFSDDAFDLTQKNNPKKDVSLTLAWAIMGDHTIQVKAAFEPYAKHGGIVMMDQTNPRNGEHGWVSSSSGENTALSSLNHEWGHMTDISDDEMTAWRIQVQNDHDEGKTIGGLGTPTTLSATSVKLDSGEVEWFDAEVLNKLAQNDPVMSAYGKTNDHEMRAEMFSDWVNTNGQTTSLVGRFLFGTDEDRKDVVSIWFSGGAQRVAAIGLNTRRRASELYRSGMSRRDADWQAFRESHGYYNRSIQGHGSDYQMNIGLAGDQQFTDRIFGINNPLNAAQLAELQAIQNAAGVPTPTPPTPATPAPAPAGVAP